MQWHVKEVREGTSEKGKGGGQLWLTQMQSYNFRTEGRRFYETVSLSLSKRPVQGSELVVLWLIYGE